MAVALLAVVGAQASPVAPGTVQNPGLDDTCGLDVVLILDESGSINTSGATGDVRNAAEAFVSGLEGTGSQVAIIEFNTRARFPIPFTPVTSATISSVFNPYINDTGGGEGYDPSEYNSTEYWTNWDDALQEVEASNADGSTPSADLVVFVTDGDPTAYNDTHPSDPDNTDVTYGLSPGASLTLPQAADHADAVKAGGSHILAAGVGNALANSTSEGRLQAISGDQEYPSPQSNLRDADYLLVTDFQELEDELRNLTTELAASCTASVDVTKMVDEADGNGYQPASGWVFEAEVSASSGTLEWIEPGPATPATPRIAFTGGAGDAHFEWRTIDSSATSSVTIAETMQTGYEFVSVSCEDEDGPIQVAQSESFMLDGLAALDQVSCTINNKRQTGTFRVIKDVVNDHGGNASANDFLLHVKDNGDDVAGSPAAGSASGTVYELPTGTYEVSESATASGYSFVGFSGDCDIDGFVSVEADQESVCVLTNDDQPADLTVITVVVNDDGGSAVPADATATINGVSTVGSASFPGSDAGVNRVLSSVGA